MDITFAAENGFIKREELQKYQEFARVKDNF